MRKLLKAGNVMRYHTIGHHMQTTGHHAWGVALLISKLHPDPSANLLKAALWHDMAEVETGDVPSPTKWDNADITTALEEMEARYMVRNGLVCRLSIEEGMWLRFADILECYLYAMNNSHHADYAEVHFRAKSAIERRVHEYNLPAITEAWRTINADNN